MHLVLSILIACQPGADTGEDTGGEGRDTGAPAGPVADAGSDVRVAGGAVVTLDATASRDPNGDPLTFSWTQVSGSPISLDDPSSPTPSFTAPDEHGLLELELVVDDGSATASDRIAITTVQVGEGPVTLDDVPLYRDPTHTARAVAVRDDVVVGVDAAQLITWDASDPAHIAVLATLDLSDHGELEHVAVTGSTAWVGAGDLVAVDLSDAAAPAVTSAWDGVADVRLVRPDGADRLWLQVGARDVVAVDVSGTPAVLGSWTAPATVEDILPDGDRLYVTAGTGGVAFLDVSDPAAPVLLAQRDWGWSFGDMALRGSHLVASAWKDAGGYRPRELWVFDVTDPAAIASPSASFAAESGGPHVADLLLDGDSLWSTRDYVQGVDLSDPLAPKPLQRMQQAAGAMRALVLLPGGELLAGYRHASGGGVVVLDPEADPLRLVDHALPLAQPLLQASVHGDRLLTAEGAAGCAVYDLADPLVPAELGRHDVTDVALCNGVDLDGDLLVFAGHNALGTVDISDPTAPTRLGTVSWPTYYARTQDAAVSGDVALADGYSASMRVIDIADPAAPSVASVTGDTGASAVAFAGGRALVGTAASLDVYDVADPAAPVLLGTWSDGGARALAVEGDRVAAASSGVARLFDVSTDVPQLLGELDTHGRGSRVALEGELVVVDEVGGGWFAVDFSTPDRPFLAAHADLPGGGGGVALAGGVLHAGADALVTVQLALPELTGPTALPVDHSDTWTFAWDPPGDDEATVLCVDAAGTCEVTSVDPVGHSATISWTLPGETGPYDLLVAVGASDWLLADRITVQATP